MLWRQDQQPGHTEKNAHWEEADIQASSGDCYEYTSSCRAVKVKEEPVNKVNEKTDNELVINVVLWVTLLT